MGEQEEATSTSEVTAEMLIEKAKEAGNNLKEIREEFPRTASALLLYERIVDKEVPNDPDALIVRDMVLGFEFDYEVNSQRLAQAVASGEIKATNAQRVNQGLDRLIEVTSDTNPQALLERTQQLLLNTKALLMPEWRSKLRTEELLRRQREVYEAMEELRPQK